MTEDTLTEGAPRARTSVLALLAGVVAAAIVPGHAPGLGLALAATAGAAAVLTARGRIDDPWRLTTGTIALALAWLSAWTDAAWVLAPALLGAVVLGGLALAGGRRWAGLARVVPEGVLAAVRAPRELSAPAADVVRRGRLDRLGPVLRTVTMTVLLVTVFGGLFASADQAFATLVEDYLLPDLRFDLWPARAVVAVVAALMVGTLVTLRPVDDAAPAGPARPLSVPEWAIPLGALTLVFAAFVAVQIGVLFAGHDHVLRTAGLTYAEYAREGFFQLLVVAGLTLGVVAAMAWWAATGSPRSRRLRDGLLGALCLLTLVVLASALRRLGLYEDAFGLTRARVSAQATAWWLGAAFVAVVAAGATRRADLLPRGLVLLTSLAVLVFGAARPDAIVASGNVARFAETGDLDVGYLSGLSADAAPALAELPPALAACLVRAVAPDDASGWAGANLARTRAREVRANLPPCTAHPVRSQR